MVGLKGPQDDNARFARLGGRVLAVYDRGMKIKQIATFLEVSRPMATPVVTEVDRTRSAQLVREDADATLAELHERLGIPYVRRPRSTKL